MQRMCFRDASPTGTSGRLPEGAHGRLARDAARRERHTGWCNYFLFTGEDGVVAGTFEASSTADAMAAMAAMDFN